MIIGLFIHVKHHSNFTDGLEYDSMNSNININIIILIMGFDTIDPSYDDFLFYFLP